MDDKNYSIMAERICRREYEKHFDTDLSKPGKQIYYNSKEEQFNFYKDVADFWNELGQNMINILILRKKQVLKK